jgi:hypothetical protein
MSQTIYRSAIAAVITAVLLASGATPSMAAEHRSTALAAPTTFIIENVHSHLDVAILNASKANAAPAIQYHYENNGVDNDAMVMEFVNSSSNWLRIKPGHTYTNDGNVHNDMCLAVLNASSALYAPIVQATCTYDNIDNDVWYEEPVPVGSEYYYQYRNRRSNLCMVVLNASTKEYARLVQYTCNGTYNSLWYWF